MSLFNRVPLAWLNLTHEIRRLLVAVAGTAFAVLLIMVQLGFRGAMFDSTVQLPRVLNADLILLSSAKMTMSSKETFPSRRLITVRASPHVEGAWPFYLLYMLGKWRNPHTGETSVVAIFAFDPNDPAILLPEVQEHAAELAQGHRVLFDRRSKPHYGAPVRGDESLLSDHQVEVIGNYTLGTDFVADGNLFTSDLTFRDLLFPPLARGGALSAIDLGLIKLKPGVNIEQARRDLLHSLEPDVTILTKDELVAREQKFWQEATPIGYIFGFGVVLAFFVGVIICYQILYSDIADHLAEYATLKAMGYRTSFFYSVMLRQSLIIAVLGFIPGWIASRLLYEYLGGMTGLPLNLTWTRSVDVLLLTIAMCSLSGLLTIRSVLTTDPAELFK